MQIPAIPDMHNRQLFLHMLLHLHDHEDQQQCNLKHQLLPVLLEHILLHLHLAVILLHKGLLHLL